MAACGMFSQPVQSIGTCRVEARPNAVYVWRSRRNACGPGMAKLTLKFGGTSVADLDRIRHVAKLVKREVDRDNQVAVVVSAMAGETNKLVGWTRDLSPLHYAREHDAGVAAGEKRPAGLLSVVPARPLVQ